MDFKNAGTRVWLVSSKDETDLANLSQTHRLMAEFIAGGKVYACHDVSDGGIAVAAAEMSIASGLGLNLSDELFASDLAFIERAGRYLVELDESDLLLLTATMSGVADVLEVGLTTKSPTVVAQGVAIGVQDLTAAWRGTLDW
jgi:phosphoribosylformylglycinamidine synthase